MDHCFYANLQGDLDVTHFEKLAGELREQGYTVATRDDAICFERHCGPKEVQFKMIERGDDFKMDAGLLRRNQVWATYTNPEWSSKNSLGVFITHRDAPHVDDDTDRAAVRGAVLTALGLELDEISTDCRPIDRDRDSAEMQRRFLGFDRDLAIKAWTRPDPDEADEESRLFECWKCGMRLTYAYFKTDFEESLMTPFEEVLRRHELQTDLMYCETCAGADGILVWTEADAERLRVPELEALDLN
jgi:hypothetical protein